MDIRSENYFAKPRPALRTLKLSGYFIGIGNRNISAAAVQSVADALATSRLEGISLSHMDCMPFLLRAFVHHPTLTTLTVEDVRMDEAKALRAILVSARNESETSYSSSCAFQRRLSTNCGRSRAKPNRDRLGSDVRP
jgi:hypothetical protein